MALLSPLDLLLVSDKEQDVIRCLIRHPQLTAKEISSRTQIPMKEIIVLLMRMVKKTQLSKLAQENGDVFQVSIGENKSKPISKSDSGKSLLDSLFG